MSATVAYRAHVLNLYDSSDAHHFQVSPGLDQVDVSYDSGSLPVNFLNLYASGVDVSEQMADNASAILAEASRAFNAEGDLSAYVDTNREALDDVDAGLRTDIDAEVARSIQIDDEVIAGLAAEVVNRQTGDSTLQNSLNLEVTRASGAETSINNALVDYKLSNDTKLDADIAELASYKSSNDAKLDSQITTYDAYVVSNDARSANIEASVVQSNTDSSGLVSAEEAARIAAVANLQTQINNLIANTDATALNSLAEIVTNYQSIDNAVISRLNSIEATLTELVNQH